VAADAVVAVVVMPDVAQTATTNFHFNKKNPDLFGIFFIKFYNPITNCITKKRSTKAGQISSYDDICPALHFCNV
jgi:hypothetical protein